MLRMGTGLHLSIMRITGSLVLLTILLAACSPATAQPDVAVYTRVSEATFGPGDPIPTPQGPIVLTVSGDALGFVELDMAAIEAVGLVEYTVQDPFLHRPITYRGPLMSELLDAIQADPDATNMRLVALNDYAIDMPVSMVREYPILFAIMADGEYMEIADRGPAMLVLPYDHYEFERPASDAFWIWQIKSIEIN
jgi:hypothetical protein